MFFKCCIVYIGYRLIHEIYNNVLVVVRIYNLNIGASLYGIVFIRYLGKKLYCVHSGRNGNVPLPVFFYAVILCSANFVPDNNCRLFRKLQLCAVLIQKRNFYALCCIGRGRIFAVKRHRNRAQLIRLRRSYSHLIFAEKLTTSNGCLCRYRCLAARERRDLISVNFNNAGVGCCVLYRCRREILSVKTVNL